MSPSERRDLHVFDVCGTLYNANTTIGFIRFLVEREGSWRDRLRTGLVLNRWSPARYVVHLLGRLVRRDLMRAVLLRQVRGHRAEELAVAAAAYVDAVLVSQRIEAVHQLLHDAVEGKHDVVLISNSIDPVIAAIARRLRVDYFSSQLAYAGGRATGRLARDLTGVKHDIVARDLRQDGQALTVVSDNASDAVLLTSADHAVIVRHGRQTHKSHSRIKAEIIDVAA